MHAPVTISRRLLSTARGCRSRFIPADDVETILGRPPTPVSNFAKLMAPLLIAKRDDDLDPILEAFKRGWVTWSDTVINVNSMAC